MGPLINPARPDAMVLGVYHKDLGQVFAEALRSAGMQRAWVVCGFEGLDELSPAGQSHVILSFFVSLPSFSLFIITNRSGIYNKTEQSHIGQ